MKELFKEVIRINQMSNPDDQKEDAKKFFEQLNAMEMPETFNWVTEIFEQIHVKHHPQKTALIWSDPEAGPFVPSPKKRLQKRNSLCGGGFGNPAMAWIA